MKITEFNGLQCMKAVTSLCSYFFKHYFSNLSLNETIKTYLRYSQAFPLSFRLLRR